MKLIHLIFIAAACCNTWVAAQDNYSLWPRRPDELDQARRLLQQQKWGEAVHLLTPFVMETGITGQEARSMTARANLPRYLSRMHPYAHVYNVKSGDTLPRVVQQTKCPLDLLMLLNGLVEPSALKIGQKLAYVDMKLRVEIYPAQREITVWDASSLVASYKITALDGVREKVTPSKTQISSRDAFVNGSRMINRTIQSASASKMLRLADGVSLAGRQPGQGKMVRMNQRDLNELSLLVRVGTEVVWANAPQPYVPSVKNDASSVLEKASTHK